MVRPTNHAFSVLIMTPAEKRREDGTVFIDYGPPLRAGVAVFTIDWPELLKRVAHATADKAESMNAEGCFSVIVRVEKEPAAGEERK